VCSIVNVRAARARRRLRQEDLADELGSSRQTVSNVEAGTCRVILADAIALCEALHIELRELLQGAPATAFEALGISPA
jgi:transcriptional regulator with XRE-family HTH domain